jgi:MFS transporter, DHA1 family, inner membrane transport protein
LTPANKLQIIFLAALRTVINTGYRMAYPFLPVFARSLGVDVSTLAMVLSVRALLGALGPFLGTIADSRGRKFGMLLGLAIFVVGFGLVAIWPALIPFALAMIFVALGKVMFDPSVHAYVGDLIPYHHRASAIALIEVSWSVSFILGVPFVGYMINRYGWSSPFAILGLLGLVTMLLVHRLIPATPSNQNQGMHVLPPTAIQNLRAVFTSSPALAGLALAILTASANESVNIVFGVWIEDNFGLQLAALGAASAVIGLSELSGESLVWILTDRLGKTRAIAGGILLNCLAALLLPFLGGSLVASMAGLFFFYITFEFTLVSSIPLMTEILPGSRATLLAANIAAFSAGRAVGAFLAPQVYTWGIWANAALVVVFNFLALLALTRLAWEMRQRSANP